VYVDQDGKHDQDGVHRSGRFADQDGVQIRTVHIDQDGVQIRTVCIDQDVVHRSGRFAQIRTVCA